MIKTISLKNGVARMQLTKRCEFWVEVDGDYYPIHHTTAKAAGAVLNQYGNQSITVTFNTLERYIEQDKKKFMSRLQKVLASCNYRLNGTEWRNTVRGGYIFDTTFETTIERCI